MAVLAFGVAGAAIGGAIGGTFLGMSAASIGWAVGSAVGQALFAPDIHHEGPRLNDLNVQASTYGNPIPYLYGTNRVSGNIIWSSGLRETSYTESHGKKGKSGPTTTTYTYFASFAVSMGRAPNNAAALLRIWADTTLIYDGRDQALNEDGSTKTGGELTGALSAILGNKIKTLYNFGQAGSGQDIDLMTGGQSVAHPAIEAHQGVGNTPAYKDQVVLVFENLELSNFGNRIPNIRAEIATSPTFTGRQLGQVSHDDLVAGWDYCRVHVTEYKSLWFFTDDRVNYEIYERPHRGKMRFLRAHALGVTTASANVWFPRNQSECKGDKAVIHVQGGATYGEFIEIVDNDTGAITRRYVAGEIVGSYSRYDNAGFFTGGDTIFVETRHDTFNPDETIALAKVVRTWGSKSAWDAAGAGSGSVSSIDAVWMIDDARGEPHIFAADRDYLWAGISYTDSQSGNSEIHQCDHDGNTLDSWEYASDWNTGAICVDITGDRVYLLERQTGPGGGDLSEATIHVLDLNNGTVTEVTGYGYTVPTDNTGPSWQPQGVGLDGLLIWGELNQEAAVDDTTYLTEIAVSLPFGNKVTLASIVGDLCSRSGLSAYDTSALTSLVRGYVVSRNASGRQCLEQLASAFFFDAVESDWQLKFITRGQSAVKTLTADDLGAHAEGDAGGDQVESLRRSELEMPRALSVTYPSVNSSHQQNEQHASRQITESRVVVSVNLPIVLSDSEARQIADVNLWSAWQQRTRRRFALPLEHIDLDPADVVTLQAPNFTGLVRLTDITLGDSGVLEVEAVDEDDATYTSTSTGADTEAPDETLIGYYGPTYYVFMDLPLLRSADNDAGTYFAACGLDDGWPGCVIMQSTDGGLTWANFAGAFNATKIGDCQDTLADGPTTIWDEAATLTVQLLNTDAVLDTAASDTTVLAGTNWAAVGNQANGWEIIGFKDVTQNADGTFTLSRLLRGLRGTDHLTGTHQSGETFVLLDNATVERLAYDTSQIGSTYDYAIAMVGRALSAAEETTSAVAGAALECFSPVHVTGARDGSGNLTLDWVRRDRLDGSWRDYVDLPMSEATESYEVDIMNGASVVRTISSLTSPTASYTAAQQTTDFGSPQASVEVNVYQLSATVGRGVAANATV